MSTNKFKYWTVTTSQLVKANNKADALAATQRKASNGAKVLGRMVAEVDRVTADEAREILSESV